MTTETNAEKLKLIEEALGELETSTLLYFNTGIDRMFERVTEAKATVMRYVEELQEENARLRSESSTVHIIKRRNGKPTVIGWNGERYVYQSDSTARGGKGRKSSG